MNKIKDRKKHIKRYIVLAIVFFVLELLLQSYVLFNGQNLVIGSIVIPHIVNYEAIFISAAMIFMGIFYIKK